METRKEQNGIAIRCRRVGKNFGDTPAVRGVDLEVQEGRFLALLGPSGCGKTTVLRMIAGLETLSSGEIEVGRRMVSGPGVHVPPERRRVGLVFQEYALFPHLNVAENVGYGLRQAREREKRVHEVLTLVGLEGIKGKMPSALSGGQQQRVALARALAPNPEVILLDEPFSNLDTALRVRVRADVRHILREAQVTAIFVTHDQEEALSLADELAVMIDGRILQCDTPEHIYHHPATHHVATFLGDANFIPGTGRGLFVECELGVLPTKKEAVGDVEVMFRPEEVTLHHAPEGPGAIVDREYFGHDQLLHIAMDSGTPLKCRIVGSASEFQLGDRVATRVGRPVTTFPSKFGCVVGDAPPQEAETAVRLSNL